MTGWTWAAARRRGTSHARTGLPCQDALRCRQVGDTLIAVVSDGAGSAAKGGAGAALAACLLAARAGGQAPSDEQVTGWIDELRTRIGAAAERRGLLPRDYAATLVAAIATPEETMLALIGDGAAAVRVDGTWAVPSWPENGEYASTTYFVTDEAGPRLRIVRMGPVDALALMSDGLERLALDFGETRAHAPFFEGIIRPVEASTEPGRDAALSASLARWLDGEAVNARTDDDKSLILAVRR